MNVVLGKDLDSYSLFLKIKALPTYRFMGRMAEFPDCYTERLGLAERHIPAGEYKPLGSLWDYQRDISRLAIDRRKFAVFADCGKGKELIIESRHRPTSIGPENPDGECKSNQNCR